MNKDFQPHLGCRLIFMPARFQKNFRTLKVSNWEDKRGRCITKCLLPSTYVGGERLAVGGYLQKWGTLPFFVCL